MLTPEDCIRCARPRTVRDVNSLGFYVMCTPEDITLCVSECG